MVNYACAFSQSEMEKYLEWIITPIKIMSKYFLWTPVHCYANLYKVHRQLLRTQSLLPDFQFAMLIERLGITFMSRQMQICTTWPSFPFTSCLLFIISSHKLVVSCNFSIHKNNICFELFLSAHSLFWEILNLNLMFDICRIREA